MADAEINHNECPYASHSCMTQHPRCANYFVSDYNDKWDILTRDKAIKMSQSVRVLCNKSVFYTDRGWSSGMKSAKEHCIKQGLPYEERTVNVVQLARRVPFLTTCFCNAVINNQEYTHYLE